ncbi:eukaryotic translation initiation factor 2A [Hetaerina americana]|uniref:eukaryotic translation initiation factor 2A n=1 Tax=Hetaerina americana TaxID=62018 RepID=UPI003A7F5289
MASPPSCIPTVAIRGSTGISLNYGPPNYDLITTFTRDDSKTCKAMIFSPDGKYFAWANGNLVKVVATANWKLLCEIEKPKVSKLAFSPKGTYLLTWESFMVTPSNPTGSNNLNIWKSETGELVFSVIHKKQDGWEPQWTLDEGVCARWVNNEVVFHENGDFDNVVHRSHLQRVATFSLSPNETPSQTHILFYVPGKQGQPSFGKLYQYGKFDANHMVASKSFFQADRVDMFWNSKGTNVLLMTSMEVDKTGASYYGKQALHSLSTKGETAMVMLSKEGPIHSVQWSPVGNEFCVIYGLMPARATLFNLKCESVFDFGAIPRNCIHYSPSGSLLILGGFGNLQGKVELWDMRGGGGKSNQRKLVAKLDAPDTTLLQWSPDGVHFLTATTAPRLRVGNGFKIWHFTGALLYERPWNKQEELWEVCWQTFPPGTFQEQLVFKPVEGITPSQPQASKQVYRPPTARGKPSNFNLHDEDTEPTAASKDGNISKTALKLRKKREAKKAKKESGALATNGGDPTVTTPAPPKVSHPALPINLPVDLTQGEIAGDPEKVKKIKNLRKKLEAIQRLKEQKESGKTLELNQLEKIGKEADLIRELEDLAL